MTRLRRPIGFLAMTLVALVVAHDLVFLITYGARYEDALALSGHDGAWTAAVAVVLLAGVGLSLLAAWRLHRLGVLARTLVPTAARHDAIADGFGGRLVGLWWRLSATTTLLFVVQENVEHLRMGEAAPGLAVLGSGQYSDATLIILGVSLVVAFVGALFRWRRDVLIARIATALRRLRLRPGAVLGRPAPTRDRRPESPVGRGRGVRAPPLPAF
jgi:hypothetical protein